MVIENAKLKLALANPIGAPIAVAHNAIEIPPLAADEKMKDLYSKSKKKRFIVKIVKGNNIFAKPFTH